MRFHVLTLFPEMVESALGESILGRASQKGLVEISAVNIRSYTDNRHNRVDDYTYGGGAGMLMQAQPVYDCCAAVQAGIMERQGRPARVLYMSPLGRVFDQKMAKELAEKNAELKEKQETEETEMATETKILQLWLMTSTLAPENLL